MDVAKKILVLLLFPCNKFNKIVVYHQIQMFG